jgi:hypothetical protein
MKKTLTITGAILFILVFIFAYYYFFFAKPAAQNSTSSGSSSFFANLFPFGNSAAIPTSTSTDTTTDQGQNPVTNGDYLEKLRLITNEPVAGASFVQATTGVSVIYMQKADGHIYEVSTYSASSTQVSNTTIPKIHNAFFVNNGTGVVAQYVGSDGDTIQTFYMNVSSTTNATILPSGMDSLAVSPSGKNIFYIIKSFTGSTGIIALPNGSNKKQIWSSAIGSVLPQYINDNDVLVTTKPTNEANGYSYIVSTKTGAVSSAIGGEYPDLSVLADPTGQNFLAYSTVNGGQLFFKSSNSATSTVLTPTTFPEKCVFDTNTPTTLYCAVPKDFLNTSALDNWYMGLVSFSDDIWKYDLKAHTQMMIDDVQSDSGRSIDATNLQLNSAGSLLLFTSKTDGSLWSLNVSGN